MGQINEADGDFGTGQVGEQTQFVRVDICDGIATVSLDRPKVNALGSN